MEHYSLKIPTPIIRPTSEVSTKGEYSMGFYLGTDVGGTFTDLWVAQAGARMRVFKAPTTADVMSGVIHAMHLASEHFELSFEDFCAQIERFGHGTTVGLNALLTRFTKEFTANETLTTVVLERVR